MDLNGKEILHKKIHIVKLGLKIFLSKRKATKCSRIPITQTLSYSNLPVIKTYMNTKHIKMESIRKLSNFNSQ